MKCEHHSLTIIHVANSDGEVELSICRRCGFIVRTICMHKINKWVYTRNQEDPEEQKLICQLCGADGT